MKLFRFLILCVGLAILGALAYVVATPPAVTPQTVTVNLDPVEAFADTPPAAPADPATIQPAAP